MADQITSEAALNDQLAVTRKLPIMEAGAIPSAPEGYIPTPADLRVKTLRKVDEKLEAELQDALEECGKRGEEMAKELSKNAPPSDKGRQLAEELDFVALSLKKAEYLTQYLRERKSILLSDGVIYVEKVKEQLDHHVKFDPQLGTHYRQTNKFFGARGASISEGIAEAKRKRAEETDEKK
jgi:hypothetical protein